MHDQKDATGKSRFTGKAARNWAIGWTRSVNFGRSPTATSIGTQVAEASAINTATRKSVRAPLPAAVVMSPKESVDRAYRPSSHKI